MEVIKKKICLEQFKSRVPGLLNIVGVNDVVSKKNASWNEIPISMTIFNKQIKYGTMMKLYYEIMDIIIKTEYYTFDRKKNKWVIKDVDWRDIIKKNGNVFYNDSFVVSVKDYEEALSLKVSNTNGEFVYVREESQYDGEIKCAGVYIKKESEELSFHFKVNENDSLILGVNSKNNINDFYFTIKKMFDDYNGFDYINEVNKILGKEIIPYFYECKECGNIMIGSDLEVCSNCGSNNITDYQPSHVPYVVYLSEVDDMLIHLEKIKNDSLNNCCERKSYKEYGGDEFYDYLLNLKEKKKNIYTGDGGIPTIDITLLFTSKLYDLGVYRTYNVDVIDEEGSVYGNGNSRGIETTGNTGTESVTGKSKVVKTSGESKLRTLRKRKCSVDDKGNELPGIYNKETNTLELPYQINYFKNCVYEGLVGDKVIFHGDFIVEMEEYASASEVTENIYCNLKSLLSEEQYEEGTTSVPIEGIETIYIKPEAITIDNTINDFCEVDSVNRLELLRNKLIDKQKQLYLDGVFCLKQDYMYEYVSEGSKVVMKSGTVYVAYNEPQIDITYVLGGRLKRTSIDGNMEMDESNPYRLTNEELYKWDGDGMWYKETLPMKKLCREEFDIDGETKSIVYDVIDFENKEFILNYEGIDFPRKNYILCENIIYKSETYEKNATHDFIFKDEKMTNINYPLRESYDVVIDRGSSAAFEKHLQLSEVKTWEDLENYRNGMFLNK